MQNIQNTQNKVFTTINEICKDSGLTRRQVYDDVLSGKLPSIKKGKYYYIPTDEASRYIIDLVCEAKGMDNEYKEAYFKLINEFEKGIQNYDKSKD